VEAFRSFGLDVKIDFVFLQDVGGLQSFKDYIKRFDMSHLLNVHLFRGNFFKKFRLSEYDLIFNIDTPSFFEYLHECKNLYVECHTPYRGNRTYLGALPDNVRCILVPSEAFRREIASEIRGTRELFVLPNSVSEIFFRTVDDGQYPPFAKRPLAYMARLDDLKNVEEALRIFKELHGRHDIMFMIIGKGATDKDFVHRLRHFGLMNKCFLREKIDFEKVPHFLTTLKSHKGIFLSPSRAESFGMAVAECITSAVPVVASDIAPHRELLDSNESFLYPLGNINEAVKRIATILDDWDHCSQTIIRYRERLNHEYFVDALKGFVSTRHNKRLNSGQSTFESELRKYFGDTAGDRNAPMFSTYLNYALTTNERGEGIAHVVSGYVSLSNKSYLDIGTAYGGYVVAFARQGCYPYRGVDVDDALIRLAKLNLQENNLDPDVISRVDITEPLPYELKDRQFDVITCADVLEHVLDLDRTVENIKSLMADKGCVLLEIPNRYHVQNVLSDPHCGLFGITLLSRGDAMQYFSSLREGKYDIGEFHELEHYLSFFPSQFYTIIKLWNEDIDYGDLDMVFHNEIEKTYELKLDRRAIDKELKRLLRKRFEDFVQTYKRQMGNRQIDYFYVQTWRVLICKK
jgi:2-polyprenyl-3-methyl-5-hydroxy-6-metoxy-1,4-benzoquinol methylase